MIEINNLTQDRVDKGFLRKVAKIILRVENKKEGGLSIALVGPKRIRELNKKYRKKDKITDVLAFGENTCPELKLGWGEIVICVSEVKKNAGRFGSNFKKELSRVVIHSILHLLGYDHEKSQREAKKMEKKQKYYLSKI